MPPQSQVVVVVIIIIIILLLLLPLLLLLLLDKVLLHVSVFMYHLHGKKWQFIKKQKSCEASQGIWFLPVGEACNN